MPLEWNVYLKSTLSRVRSLLEQVQGEYPEIFSAFRTEPAAEISQDSFKWEILQEFNFEANLTFRIIHHDKFTDFVIADALRPLRQKFAPTPLLALLWDESEMQG